MGNKPEGLIQKAEEEEEDILCSWVRCPGAGSMHDKNDNCIYDFLL
jgi:hypothetical protein